MTDLTDKQEDPRQRAIGQAAEVLLDREPEMVECEAREVAGILYDAGLLIGAPKWITLTEEDLSPEYTEATRKWLAEIRKEIENG